MTRITPDLIKNLITRNGELYIPESMTSAIAGCVTSDADVIQQEGERLKKLYESYEQKMEPISVNYSTDATIDAYSVYYLPRNTLVPKIAILCCAYHPAFQNLPDRLRVLDLGSGTGGVVLGLLDLFQNNDLAKIRVDIVALDASSEALRRQEQLVEHIGFADSSLYCRQMDLSNPASYKGIVSAVAPYDMVFAANIFTELDEPAINTLLKCTAINLSPNGMIVNVEASRKYTRRLQARIVKDIESLGLHIYYPCPPNSICVKPECWMWREDQFECPDIVVRNKALMTTPIQKAYWMMFCRNSCSIFDVLLENNPKLIWGATARIGKERTDEDKREQDYEVCTINGPQIITHTSKKQGLLWILQREKFKRGSFVGSTDDFSEVKTWDIVSGFESYKGQEI